MTPAEARALVAQCLAEVAPEADLSRVGDAEDLRQALDLDSFDFLQLVTRLGRRIGRDIPDADARTLATLGGCVAYLTSA